MRWNIAVPAGAAVAADVLAERLTATATAAADVAGLQAQLRTLAGFAALPVVAVAPAPAGLAAVPDQETFDRAWLEVVAAVRPALARLEAWQLGGVGWVAWSTNPAQPWGIGDHVAGYGPPRTLEGGGDVGLVLLDRWAETVPFHSHTTTAAFGFTTPTARAPQAVLVGVAPDLSKPLDTATLVDIVLDVRRLARARMATPDMLSRYQAGLPTSMLLASGPAATDLERLVP